MFFLSCGCAGSQGTTRGETCQCWAASTELTTGGITREKCSNTRPNHDFPRELSYGAAGGSRLQRIRMAELATVPAHETCSERDVWGHLLWPCQEKSIEKSSLVMGGPLRKWSTRSQSAWASKSRLMSRYGFCENRKCKFWISRRWKEIGRSRNPNCRRRQQALLMGLTCNVEKPKGWRFASCG